MSWVYLIHCQHYYKIGIANDVEARMIQLATGNPFEITLVSCYEFKNASVVETSIHQRFSGSRKRGEWFELSEKDVDDFNKICALLGGRYSGKVESPTEDEIAEAEEVAEIIENTKWDFRSMFFDGWRMEVGGDGSGKYNYWCWRKRNKQENWYIYGGKLSDLPYSIEEMRTRYGKQE